MAVFDSILEELEPEGICAKILGGGRILNEEDNKKIKIYGTSRVSRGSLVLEAPANGS